MGEVGTTSKDSNCGDLKLNGIVNGNSEDEPMEIDAKPNADASQITKCLDADNNKTVNKLNSSEIIKSENEKNIISDKKKSNGDENVNGRCNKTNDKNHLTDEETTVVLDDSIEDNDNKKEEKENKIETITKVKQNGDMNIEKHKVADTVDLSDGDDEMQTSSNAQEEVHAISDSEDDDVIDDVPQQNKNVNLLQKSSTNSVNAISVQKTNGTNNSVLSNNNKLIIDDDKPVSIHSDSDIENDKNEVHEILSDKEDCVVIEDDRKIGANDLSSRRTNRSARKSVVRPREITDYDDDIEEIIEDPLSTPPSKKMRPNNLPQSISIQEVRDLSMGNKSKEPTLVIIDTNNRNNTGGVTQSTVQALQKQNVSVLPVGMPTQHIFPTNLPASITPVPNNNLNNFSVSKAATTIPATLPNIAAGLSPLINAPVLTSLTDDMFVLEAPSFIVPYIYEKPPTNELREIVNKMATDIEEDRKKEKEREKENEKEKSKEIDDKQSDAKDDDKQIDGNEMKDDDKSKKSKKKKPTKNADDSWDESDTSTDDEASDTEERTKILIKEVKTDLDAIKPIINNQTALDTSADDKKDCNNYFESPLGKFFMDIGVSLVQEHVQTDLLRQQKRKLNREGAAAAPSVQLAINSLMKNLEHSKSKNEIFKFETKRCEYCNFKSESSLVMAHHYETPHMKANMYKCNFCSYEVRPPYDILFHMKSEHNITARLEKALSYHQCPNCMFEDNGKSKLARHAVVCTKKFRPEVNLAPSTEWEPPAKIPRIKPRHGLVGTANAYQAMAAQAQRAAAAAIAINNSTAARNRGRPTNIAKTTPIINNTIRANQQSVRPQITGGISLPNNFQYLQATGSKQTKSSQQPSISITALPRGHQSLPAGTTMSATSLQQAANSLMQKPSGLGNMKPGQSPQAGGKTSFVICEICDGYIKDLDQLRNHMQWMHKVKIHPKMIYNRPPLNCQKCQFRFFTDQGLERHLLGSHGLVTSSMQEAANKGKDAGRCPVCGRMYQWKLLNHVSREHNMTLKPAHLSYKCTVCTATFGMYKQFENHVYSAHSTVAKKSIDKKNNTSTNLSGMSSKNIGSGLTVTSTSGGDSLLKPLKINDEITIIPQPARSSRTIELESHVID